MILLAELLDLLVRSMIMLGYHQESIKRAIIELAKEYEKENLCN